MVHPLLNQNNESHFGKLTFFKSFISEYENFTFLATAYEYVIERFRDVPNPRAF